MSSSIKHTLGLCFVVSLVVALVACAQGQDTQVDDDDDTIDAPRPIDGPLPIDAPQPIDARIVDAPIPTDGPTLPDGLTIPDGPLGGCTSHAQCGTGMCCFGMLTCVPGTPQPLPPPFDCIPS